MPIKVKKLLKLIACIAYSLVFAEVFLRIFAPVAIFPRYVTAAPYGVRVNEANKSYWHTSSEVCFQIRTNSKGVRADEEFSYLPRPGVKRIVVLGDSFAMGYEATLEQMFTTQMQNSLIAKGINVEVINLAVSGHGNAEELIVLREEGLNYRPDLVLICWHSSDLSENVRSALFELNGAELVRKNQSYLPGIAIQSRLYQIPGYELISTQSHLYSWIREGLSVRVIKPMLLLWQQMQRVDEEDDGSPGEEGTEYSNKLTTILLKQLSSESKSAGAQFAILDIPQPAGGERLQSLLPAEAANEFPVISPIPELEAIEGHIVFHKYSHRHFTPTACKTVGEVLAREILQRKLLTGHK